MEASVELWGEGGSRRLCDYYIWGECEGYEPLCDCVVHDKANAVWRICGAHV